MRALKNTTFLLAILISSFLASRATAQDDPIAERLEKRFLNPAVNEPDRFAWEVFVAVNRSADNKSNDTIWETWASTSYVYDDPCRKPQWPGKSHRPKDLRQSALLRLLNHQAAGQTSGFDAADTEETRMNKPAFDYITDKGLWYKQGVLAASARGDVDLPRESIIIKANWTPIEESDKPRYHWQEYKGQLLGLDAFHLVNKSLPRWFWSTFEHVDNAGRCDDIGCKDHFGSEPRYVAPHREPGRAYPAGRLSPELIAMFDEAGLDPVWRHYRLKGSQVDYTDPQGRPTLLGSSVLEPGFASTSSCITCHGRASTSSNDVAFDTLSIVKSLMPLQGFVGAPEPAWFANRAPLPVREAPIVYRTDFLWELADMPRSREHCDANELLVCEGAYALCAAAPCRPIPKESGGGFEPDEALCDCLVKQGPNIGTGSCDSRSTGRDGRFLISTYSFALAESHATMTCPGGDYTNCFGAACVVDEKDRSKATCKCAIVTDDDRPFVTQGGGCDTAACSRALWSGAAPDANVLVNEVLASDLGLEHVPVERCALER